MNQQPTAEQGWDQLQAHIESFFNQFLGNDVPGVGYKPRFITHLPESPPEGHQNKRREMST